MDRLISEIKQLTHLNFKETKYYYPNSVDIYSLVFSANNTCLILDKNITKKFNDTLYNYAEYISHQNELMHNHKSLYRFVYDNNLDEIINTYKLFIDEEDDDYVYNSRYIQQRSVDNTPIEHYFEKCFESVYGSTKLDVLTKEYNLSTLSGNNIFVDYVIDSGDVKFAIEENGVIYHHPQIIGIKRYLTQLEKQNSLVYYNFKVYRWTTEHLKYQDKVCDNIKTYFGDANKFINNTVIQEERKVSILDLSKDNFELYDHQKEILNSISKVKKENLKTFLVVLPTATGKSQIGIEEIKELISVKRNAKVLILVPTRRIKNDWLNNISKLEKENSFINYGTTINDDICISSYRYMYKAKHQVDSSHFDYIIFDEAHHAVAPECRKILEYFNPSFLLGLTATPERLDKRRLETIFGVYNSKLSLVEAIEKKVIVPIRAFRLESNINLKEIRFNGHDYNNADLEKQIRVESRNVLIANTVKKYFVNHLIHKQGIVFCINVKHALAMEKELNKIGIKAKAVYGNNPNNDKIFDDYRDKKIDFLCSCDLITEGWDSPQTEVVIMARPTLSKVVYTQQLGRGLRKYEGKEALYVIDVVDQYGSILSPWNVHSLLNINTYAPFVDVLYPRLKTNELIEVQGLFEQEIALREIDIFTFENKYGDYLSLEETARELFISTSTLRSWIRKKEVEPSLSITIGSKPYIMFSSESINSIRRQKDLKIHNDETIKEDFFDYINQKDYTFSFKMIFMLSSLKLANHEGDININNLLLLYREFYYDRIKKGLMVDRKGVIYDETYLTNDNLLKTNILSNPFEKFERKRFMYINKDLNVISFNPVLWNKLSKQENLKIKEILVTHLNEYYKEYDGLQSIEYLF